MYSIGHCFKDMPMALNAGQDLRQFSLLLTKTKKSEEEEEVETKET